MPGWPREGASRGQKTPKMNNLVINRSQLVYAQLGTTGGSVAAGNPYRFTPVENMTSLNISVYGVEAFGATQLAVTPDGQTVCANSVLDQLTLTLVDSKGNEVLKDFPVYNLVRANIGGFANLFADYNLDMVKCYVKITDTTGVTAGTVVAFNWYYNFIR